MSLVDQRQQRGAELPVVQLRPRDCGSTVQELRASHANLKRWGLMEVLGEGHDEDGYYVMVRLLFPPVEFLQRCAELDPADPTTWPINQQGGSP